MSIRLFKDPLDQLFRPGESFTDAILLKSLLVLLEFLLDRRISLVQGFLETLLDLLTFLDFKPE